jgi:putative hydrolase of the HAD superfamily
MSKKKMNHISTSTKKFLEGIRVISFDVGFTLIYTEPPVGIVYAKIARRFGYHLNGEEVHSRFRETWKTKSLRDQKEKIKAFANEEQAYQWWKGIVRESLGDSVNPKDVDDIFRVCFQEYAKGDYWRLYPEVLQTLTTIHSKGFRLVVLSNWDRRLLRTLKDLGLDGFFEKIYVSTLIGYAKPNPGAFQHVVEDLKVPRQEILHVGDTLDEDILGAQQANIRSVCIDRRGKSGSTPGEVPVISSLTELLE